MGKCGGQNKQLPANGYGDSYSYFKFNAAEGVCKVVNEQGPYHIGTLDDYKRCMCEGLNPSDPEAKCPQATGGNIGGDGGNNGGDGGNNGGNGGNPVTISDPTKKFDDIWKKQHYDENEPSRTLYQVDRSLDYIEEKLIEIHAIFKAKGLVN